MSDFLKINVDSRNDQDAQQALPVADIGEMLRAQRLKRNLSQEDAASELRMDIRQLDALENNRFEIFSGPVYVQGYLRNYAKLLDLDPAPIVNEFNKATKIKTPEIVAIKKVMTSAGGDSQIPLSKFSPVILGIITLALIVWLGDNLYSFLKDLGKSGENTEVVTSDSGVTEIDVLNRFQQAQDRLNTSTETPPSEASTAMPLQSGVSTTTMAEVAQAAASVAEVPPVVVEEAPVVVAAVAKVNATFRFKEDSWVEVFDANDERLFARIGAAGTKAAVEGVPPLRVILGNAPAVEVEFEGKPHKFRISANSQVARFKLGKAD